MPNPKPIPDTITDFQTRLRKPQTLTGAEITSVKDALNALSKDDKTLYSEQLRRLSVGVEQASSHHAINADAGAELQKLRDVLPEPHVLDHAAHHGQHMMDDAREIAGEAPATAKKVWNAAGKNMEKVRSDMGEDMGKGFKTLGEQGLEAIDQYRALHNSDNYIIRGAAYALTGLGVYWLANKIMGTSKTGFFGKIFRGLGLVALATGVYTFVNHHTDTAEKSPNGIIATLPKGELINRKGLTIQIGAQPKPVEIVPEGFKIDGHLHTIDLHMPTSTETLEVHSVCKTPEGKLYIATRKKGSDKDIRHEIEEKDLQTALTALKNPPHKYEKTLLGVGVTIQRGPVGK